MNTYTEDEMRQKWCPFARTMDGHVQESIASVNRITRGPKMGLADSECMCIASKCSQWLWAPEFKRHEELEAVVRSGEKVTAIKMYREITGCTLKEAAEWFNAGARIPTLERRGYCGQARER